MNFLKLLMIVFWIGFSAPSWAVTVRGVPSCGTWVKDRATTGDAGKWSVLVDSGWINGYLSAFAMLKDSEFLKGADSDSIKLWMDQYCNAHPLDSLADGSYLLANELEKRMHK